MTTVEGLDWDDLKVLLAIERRGSVSAAARSLDVDQSTVTRRLTAVEMTLGTTLFVRSRAGLQPTDAGNVAIASAEAIERQTAQMMGEIYAVDRVAAGFVRIIANAWLISHVLVPALPDFTLLHPNVEVRFIADSRPRSITRREADLGLWFEVEPTDTEICFEVGKVPYAVYAPLGRDPDTLPYVSFWDDHTQKAPMRWLDAQPKSSLGVAMTANDALSVHQAIRAGVGKGLIPMWLANADDRVVRVDSANAGPELVRTLHGHAHPDLMEGMRFKAALTWVRAAIASRMKEVG